MSTTVDIAADVETDAYTTADLGRAIRMYRRRKGWTQAELAEWLRVSRATVVSLERGGPVSVAIAMRALTLLGAKVVVVPKDTDASDNAG